MVQYLKKLWEEVDYMLGFNKKFNLNSSFARYKRITKRNEYEDENINILGPRIAF